MLAGLAAFEQTVLTAVSESTVYNFQSAEIKFSGSRNTTD